jgi:hypothetical protein
MEFAGRDGNRRGVGTRDEQSWRSGPSGWEVLDRRSDEPDRLCGRPEGGGGERPGGFCYGKERGSGRPNARRLQRDRRVAEMVVVIVSVSPVAILAQDLGLVTGGEGDGG